jgi:hypothetical protein
MARSLPLLRAEAKKDVLIRFTESVRVRLWGKQLHSYRKGEIHRVSIAVAGVLLAQRCAEPVVGPPAIPQAEVAA